MYGKFVRLRGRATLSTRGKCTAVKQLSADVRQLAYMGSLTECSNCATSSISVKISVCHKLKHKGAIRQVVQQ